MTLNQFARKARSLALAGAAMLAGTTFQNGCANTSEMYGLLDTLGSYYGDYSGYGSDYSDYSGGYSTYGGSSSNLDWPLLDVKSG